MLQQVDKYVIAKVPAKNHPTGGTESTFQEAQDTARRAKHNIDNGPAPVYTHRSSTSTPIGGIIISSKDMKVDVMKQYMTKSKKGQRGIPKPLLEQITLE